MNIDGLHKTVGSDALEMHGVLSKDDEMNKVQLLYNKLFLYGNPITNQNGVRRDKKINIY